MAILKYITPIAAALLLTACYEDFDPNIDIKPVLCINSVITAGQPAQVEVSRTWLYTEGSDSVRTAKDAIVNIYANGVLQDAKYRAKEGDTIRIHAVSKTYGEAEAQVVVPQKAPGEVLSVTPSLIGSKWEDVDRYGQYAAIDFSFDVSLKVYDPENDTDNYFYVAWDNFKSNVGGTQSSNWGWGVVEPVIEVDFCDYSSEPIFNEHVNNFDHVMGNGGAYANFFTDRQFAGKDYVLRLLFERCKYMTPIDRRFNPDYYNCGINIIVETISRSNYNWKEYLWQRNAGSLEQLGQSGYSEPIPSYSNVSTGAGIVMARTVTKYKINLHDFFQSTIGR